ncbi:MAG: SDR family oxidoreductase, partial [Bacteroidia bacterium]|nr:SDR family oxidoreductase [Bacteroidia bacterium]MDW8334356.1 SDR family oxidoreductase [Bacteroidia bacterium]
MKKTVVITGVSRGIGLAIAERFAREGFDVVGCASTEQSAARTREKFPSFDVFKADLCDKNDLEAFCEHIKKRPDPIEVLVNNAGRFIPGKIETESDQTFQTLMALNVGAPYFLTKRLLGRMNAGSTIVNVCSTASITAYPNGASYCISKF